MDLKPRTALSVLRIRLDDVARRGFPLFTGRAEGSPPGVVGECFAYDYTKLVDTALQQGIPWHQWLLGQTIAGLVYERSPEPVFAFYEMPRGLVRLFLCRKQERPFRRASRLLIGHPPFIECGRDLARFELIRPLAYWEPPATAVVLWPLPADTRSGPYVVDAGNMVAFFSYPEADHAESISVDAAGPDYIRVPAQEWSVLVVAGSEYRCLNRWAIVEDAVEPDDRRPSGPASRR
jgi:hypothetical protein